MAKLKKMQAKSDMQLRSHSLPQVDSSDSEEDSEEDLEAGEVPEPYVISIPMKARAYSFMKCSINGMKNVPMDTGVDPMLLGFEHPNGTRKVKGFKVEKDGSDGYEDVVDSLTREGFFISAQFTDEAQATTWGLFSSEAVANKAASNKKTKKKKKKVVVPESSEGDSDYTEDTESSLERVRTARRSSRKKKPKPCSSMIERLQATGRSKTNSKSRAKTRSSANSKFQSRSKSSYKSNDESPRPARKSKSRKGKEPRKYRKSHHRSYPSDSSSSGSSSSSSSEGGRPSSGSDSNSSVHS